jgi:hypothetical protein
MWADDPWMREQSDAARQRAGQALANQLDDIARRAQVVAHETAGSWWESSVSDRAHAEAEGILTRLSKLRDSIWSAVG